LRLGFHGNALDKPYNFFNRCLIVPEPVFSVGFVVLTFTANQAFADAATQNRLERLQEGIAVTKSAMPVLGEGGMIRHLVL
jgi:hypothetical protein